jgi:hypothetical protein
MPDKMSTGISYEHDIFFYVCIHPEEQAFLLIRTLAGHTHILLLGEMDTCVRCVYFYTHSLTMRIGYIGAYLREQTGNLMPPTREKKKK